MSDTSLPRPKGETNAPKRAHELFGVEIQFSWLEQLLGFLDRFSATERSEYVALLQANVSEKRPSALYPKYKFHKTLEAQRVWNFAEEQSLGAGWRDRLYQPGEEQTPDEPLVEVEEILHKSRSQLLQELLNWLVLRARSIVDSHAQARDLKSIPTNLIFSAVWLDRQTKTQKAQNAETMSDEYQILSKVDYHTRIDCAKLRPELVAVLNVAEYVAALEDVERRNAPPPSLAELSLAEQKRHNAILQELLEIQKRPPLPPPPKEEVPKPTLGTRSQRSYVVDGKKLKSLRGSTKLKQEGLAEACGVAPITIRRGEAGKPWDQDTFAAVARGLSRLLKRDITPEELKAKPQPPQ